MLVGHKKQWDFLKKKFESNQLSHAYLFTGRPDDGYPEIGKKTFAIEFADFIGCKFPDLLIVESINSTSSIKNKKDSLEIDIGQIRDAQKFLSYKAYNGGIKIVIVDNAERMNVEAQSCFLKTLEEPKGKTLLILISSKPDMFLGTIYSRCQTIKFFRPKGLQSSDERVKKEEAILKNLLLVMNANLADKFKYAKSIDFDKQDLGEILEVMQKYYRSILLADYTQKKAIKILNLIEDINKKLLFTNANPKLALEILLMET